MRKSPKVTSVDDYIASASPEARVILEQIRRVVRAAGGPVGFLAAMIYRTSRHLN
jgi:hypothetical protein